jgi:ornithine cyclodeaminase
MACVRKLRRVRVWSRTPAHARAFAEAGAATSGLQIEVADDAEAAVAGADLVCTVSAARSPILAGPWIAPGTHVNAVGASTPDTAEIDSDLVARARYFVDFRASTHAEAGEYLRALASGVIGPEHILGEIGEIVAGRIAGRRSADEITVFKSLGIAAEDVAVARWLLDRAQAAGVGQVADI